jgi:hypothetical protein
MARRKAGTSTQIESVEFKIEQGIEIPPRRSGALKYPFDQMNVGDSFFIPEDSSVKPANVSNSAQAYGKQTGRKFTVRRVEGGYRCWRTE